MAVGGVSVPSSASSEVFNITAARQPEGGQPIKFVPNGIRIGQSAGALHVSLGNVCMGRGAQQVQGGKEMGGRFGSEADAESDRQVDAEAVDDEPVQRISSHHIQAMLFQAVLNNDVDEAQHWLRSGADVNGWLDPNGNPDLPYAFWSPLHFAVHNDCRQMVGLLLAHRADVNQSDQNGRIPLHHAVLNKSLELLWFLMTPLTLNRPDIHGETPLIMVVKNSFDRHSEGIIRALVKNGADINYRNIEDVYFPGRTVMKYAEDTLNLNAMALLSALGEELDNKQE